MMDKINNYVPVPMPIPTFPKPPCLTPLLRMNIVDNLLLTFILPASLS